MSSTGIGVHGEILNGSGAAVMGETPQNSQQSRAILGINRSNGELNTPVPGGLAVAVEGISTPNSGTRVRGVRGETMSSNGIGVEGLASSDFDNAATPSTGVLGESRHPRGVGVRAVNTNPSPNAAARALFAQVAGPGTAVEAEAHGTDGIAIKASGQTIGVDAYGTIGLRSNGALEVNGDASISADATITGTLTVNGAGGGSHQILGDLTVGGTLCATSVCAPVKNFRIDHPLDPANKYLYHTSVESADMMNIYNGNVVTDAAGCATVELPDWFEALNRDFRYQLTVIDDGDDFVQAKVTREVADNRFSLRTSKPHVKVSWQVTGIRQDAWANANRIAVEVDKPADERGTFLHPAAQGQPPKPARD
jgi:hypothetical protein